MIGEKCLAWGLVEKIGSSEAALKHNRHDGLSEEIAGEITEHSEAIQRILEMLLSPDRGVISNISEVDAVGHRVVHGGESFTGSVIISDEVMEQISDCIELAPLHNPHNICGIKACQNILPDKVQVGVFDTAFHQGMPEYSYLYALPYELYTRYSIRRYGFHGTSHRYVSDRFSEITGRPLENLKLITCHLGNGCSIAAVKEGISIDTSMGFTPVEGLMMGTRTGDLDPAALLFIMDREKLKTSQANTLINKESGLLGISGISNDLREIESAAQSGNTRADTALNMFCFRIKKYIGAYSAAMGGVDGVVFTGGIGENSASVRSRSLSGLEFLGIEIDQDENERKDSGERSLSRSGKVQVMIIPTNEELVIARDTLELVT